MEIDETHTVVFGHDSLLLFSSKLLQLWDNIFVYTFGPNPLSLSLDSTLKALKALCPVYAEKGQSRPDEFLVGDEWRGCAIAGNLTIPLEVQNTDLDRDGMKRVPIFRVQASLARSLAQSPLLP